MAQSWSLVYMPTALLVAVAALASVRLLQSGSWRAYAVSGLAIELATSMKYTAVVVAVPVVLATLLRCPDRARPHAADLSMEHNHGVAEFDVMVVRHQTINHRVELDDKRAPKIHRTRPSVRKAAGLPLAGVCAVLAFLATTPYALLDRPAFLKGLQFERQHYATGHAGMDGNASLFYASYLATHEGLLVAMALVAVAAVTMCDRQRWPVAVVLASFPVGYSALVAMQAVRNDRTIMLVLPPLAVHGTLAIQPLMMTYTHHHRAVGLAAAGTAIAVLVIGALVRLPYRHHLPGMLPSTGSTSTHHPPRPCSSSPTTRG
jgi:hypothetical protein